MKAIALWASSTSEACDYRFHRYPEVAQAVAEIARAHCSAPRGVSSTVLSTAKRLAPASAD